MDLANFFAEELSSKKVSFVRTAMSTLILYFDGEPGEDKVMSLWLNPPWRLVADGRVVVGSADAGDMNDEHGTDLKGTERLLRIRAGLGVMLRAEVVAVSVHGATTDLRLEMSCGVLETFSPTENDDEIWVIRCRRRDVCLVGASGGIEETAV